MPRIDPHRGELLDTVKLFGGRGGARFLAALSPLYPTQFGDAPLDGARRHIAKLVFDKPCGYLDTPPTNSSRLMLRRCTYSRVSLESGKKLRNLFFFLPTRIFIAYISRVFTQSYGKFAFLNSHTMSRRVFQL
jgi:hypothetical protein